MREKKDLLGHDAHYFEEYAQRARELGDGYGAAVDLFQAARLDKYLRSQRQHYSGYLFASHYIGWEDMEKYREEQARDLAESHFAYGYLYEDEELLPPPAACRHGKIRVGYLAPRFTESSVMRFAEPLLLCLDRSRFEVYAFAMEEAEDAFTAALKEKLAEQGEGHYCCLWGLSLEEGAWAVREREIDILFDLGGHSEGGMTLMILAKRPAPVQLTGLGYFNTLGLPPGRVDGLLADGSLFYPGEEGRFTEPLWLLPQAFAFRPTEEMAEFRGKLSGFGRQGTITFGVLQNIMKVNNVALRAWGRILKALPEARLIIQDAIWGKARLDPVKEEYIVSGGPPYLKERLENLYGEAKAWDLPLDRVEIRPGSPRYFETYREIDLVLDTFPYPGGFMTALALYFGVPVITFKGYRYGSRFGASLLKAAGREAWIAGSMEEYVKLAVEMGREPEALRQERERLFEEIAGSALLDTDAYVESVEEKYLELWQNGK